MDLIHKFMNIVVPPTALFTLSLFLPPFLFFKLFMSILSSIFSENVAGKVVLITGASSGIGEQLAYEYAKRGACLVLVARRENRLREVADRAYGFGSPDVVVVRADVSKVDECKRCVDEAVNYFGRLDHLVNNAGIASVCMFEEATDITNFAPVMDTNFWGSVFTTYFAVPHLRKSKGRIIVMASAAGWLPVPRMSIYNASKAALIILYETLRIEFGADIKVTIVTPGYIESEMTQGKFLTKEGVMEVDQEMRDVQVGVIPVGYAEGCAKAIVKGACRGERYLTEPSWFKVTYLWKVFCPEVVEWWYHFLCVAIHYIQVQGVRIAMEGNCQIFMEERASSSSLIYVVPLFPSSPKQVLVASLDALLIDLHELHHELHKPSQSTRVSNFNLG